MDRPEKIGDNKATTDYIEYLEGCLNGSSELILELNMTSRVFAKDLEFHRTGEGDAKYIGKSDKTKKFEHVMTLFDKFDKIKALASIFKGIEKEEKERGNAFEEVSRRVSEKLNGKGK